MSDNIMRIMLSMVSI